MQRQALSIIFFRKCVGAALALIVYLNTAAQSMADTTSDKKWTTHFQVTVISQIHSGFRSIYSGENSLADSVEPTATSLTATLFLGRKLWKGASFYFNPEISGGRGLSFTKGVAGALNGETYRVGNEGPEPFIARAFLQQYFALPHSKMVKVEDDLNEIGGELPDRRITVSAGRFAISDFFDDNSYAKDPRTQFLNWSIWANGAWDYPANTRGYTYGIVFELIKPRWTFRLSSVAVPSIANFHLMEYSIRHAHSETVEFDHSFFVASRHGQFRFILSNTESRAPSYKNGIAALAQNNRFLLDVVSGNTKNNVFGGHKLGAGINLEQQIGKDLGAFCRLGWNDGKYASWAFTEIDRTICVGLSLKGTKWRRSDDVFGAAIAVNGISSDHRAFLKAGGYGFIIGDGDLNYGHEGIVECYYSARVLHSFWLSLDYQFVKNPAYNKDRGPVNVFGVRFHLEF